MEVFDTYSLPSSKRILNFDNATKESILTLLMFFNKKDLGLPLSNQNIFSNFISYIFLFELDNFIQKLKVCKKSGFSYLRYVDDFFIIFYEDEDVENDRIGKIIFDVSTSVSDFLINNLDLKINHLKSKKWIIENESDFNAFLSSDKFTSFSDPYLFNTQNTPTPKEKLDKVCEIIQQLKSDFKDKGKTELNIEQDGILKEVFTKTSKDYTRSKSAKKKLDIAFKDWVPILTLNSIKALMFLLGRSETGFNLVKKYLKNRFELKIKKTQNLSLLERFINLEKYDNSLNSLVLKTKSKSQYYNLIKRMIIGKVDKIKRYLPIDDELLLQNDALMQQIKMLVIAEEEGKYNLAFNHLLNTFHSYCWISEKSTKDFKYYNQIDIESYLTKLKVSISEISFVMSFFDRRNKNNISHPGDNSMENWVVNKSEYTEYYIKMVKLMKRKINI